MTGVAERDGHLPGAYGIAVKAFFDSVLKDVAGSNTAAIAIACAGVAPG